MQKWAVVVAMTALFFLNSARASSVDTLSRLSQEAEAAKLWENPEWLRLVHYRKNFFGGYTSEADGLNFFVSASGRSDPASELKATLSGFFSAEVRELHRPPLPSQSVRCQFPARFRWLSRQLHFSENDLPKQICSDFLSFKEKVSAKSVTFVFSSYYPNNPSSTFGHTLLRLNKNSLQEMNGSELADSGISYAANPYTKNPFLYSLLGLAGGFKGTFSHMPYYFKVREYNDFESRDLWEYDLNYTQEEVQFLVEHLWEMGSTFAYYYYLTNNCSYQLLAVLDAISPKLSLLQKVPFWVIPVDTVKAIAKEPGLVNRVRFRPSIFSQLQAREKDLNRDEKKKLRSIYNLKIFKAEMIADLPPTSRSKVLDTLVDSIDFRYAHELQDNQPEISSWKQDILVSRSQLPMGSSLKNHDFGKVRPDLGHATARAYFGLGQTNDSVVFSEFQMRFALHDLLDPLEGYPPHAQVEFFRFTGRYEFPSQALYLQNFRLVQVASFSPLAANNIRPSWKVDFGGERFNDNRCNNCLAAIAALRGGASLQFSSGFFVYALLGPQFSSSPLFQNEKFILEASSDLGFRWVLQSRWSLGGSAQWSQVYARNPFNTNTLTLDSRWVPDLVNGFEGRLKSKDNQQEYFVNYLRYF